MEDWSLPDNSIMDNMLFWKLQGMGSDQQQQQQQQNDTDQPPPAAHQHQQHPHHPPPHQLHPAPPPGHQQQHQQQQHAQPMDASLDSFQDEVDKLFQESLALQQQEHHHHHQHPHPHQNAYMQPQQQQPQPHPYANRQLSMSSDSFSPHEMMMASPPTQSSSAPSTAVGAPGAAVRKRSRSSATFDAEPPKRPAFMDASSFMVDPNAVYRLPYASSPPATAPAHAHNQHHHHHATASSSPSFPPPYTNKMAPPPHQTHQPQPSSPYMQQQQQQQQHPHHAYTPPMHPQHHPQPLHRPPPAPPAHQNVPPPKQPAKKTQKQPKQPTPKQTQAAAARRPTPQQQQQQLQLQQQQQQQANDAFSSVPIPFSSPMQHTIQLTPSPASAPPMQHHHQHHQHPLHQQHPQHPQHPRPHQQQHQQQQEIKPSPPPPPQQQLPSPMRQHHPSPSHPSPNIIHATHPPQPMPPSHSPNTKATPPPPRPPPPTTAPTASQKAVQAPQQPAPMASVKPLSPPAKKQVVPPQPKASHGAPQPPKAQGPSQAQAQTQAPAQQAQQVQQAQQAPAPIAAPAPAPEPLPLHMSIPRPQLRLHLTKRRPESPKPCEREDKDPMAAELDMVHLQKLTVMILRSLGVTMATDELPAVDIDQALDTDSEQVLPPAAMQLITKMILGTSGDKDVAQTVGSQISNGDLVALQRMIVAGLKSKNIVIHTIQSTPTSSTAAANGSSSASASVKVPDASTTAMKTSNNNSSSSSSSSSRVGATTDATMAMQPTKKGDKTIYDLSKVTYHTPKNVTRLFLRLYRFILNTLLSTPDCWPFIQPVPASAVFYHQEVKYPMDLSTVELNLWSGLYTRFAKFEQDMQLIWKNAKAFHGSVGTIPKHAENLEQLFYKVVLDTKQAGKSVPVDFRFDASDSLPEEGDFAYPPMSQVFSKTTVVYGIAAMSPFEPRAKKPKGLTDDKQLYLQLNGPFFQALEQMKQSPLADHPPVPRFYIAKNRTLLRQVRAQGVLAIFFNTRTTRIQNKQYRIVTDMVLTYPASTLFDIEQTNDFAARGWMHLRPLRLVENLEFRVNETIERDYFRRMYATSKLMLTEDHHHHHHHHHHHNHHHYPSNQQQAAQQPLPQTPASAAKAAQINAVKAETRRMLKKMVQQILDLPVAVEDEEMDDVDMPLATPPPPPPSSARPTVSKSGPTTTATSTAASSNKSSSATATTATPTSLVSQSTSPKRGSPGPATGGKRKSTPVVVKTPGKKDTRSATSSPFSTPEDRQPSSTLSPDSLASTPASPMQPLKMTSPMDTMASSRPESEMLHQVWQRLLETCGNKGATIVNVQQKYENLNWSAPDSEGFFKQVYFLEDVVVQTFRQMTMHQRITEVACLMKLRNLPHMAQLREILHNDNGDIVGLSMERYQTTLKQYTHVHSHHRLSAYQKFHVIHQMLVCMKTIHCAGLAHRDLSEVNIMVNNVDGELEDGSSNICLYLIDFGKAVFCEPQDVREWFVDVPRGRGEYDGDVVPESAEELDEWCSSLPWIKGKPDHGYRMYRSIQTLPKTRSDNQVLPWLILPQAEDMYSIGVMIWKIFTETEPWRGILDTDLQGLRYVAEDDYRIQRALEHEVQGELSRQLLLKCLRTQPQERATAHELLTWIESDEIRTGLLNEWKMYSSETRSSRKSKAMYGFEDPDAILGSAPTPSNGKKASKKSSGRSTRAKRSSSHHTNASGDMMNLD
ncbi:hypothetical protein BC940DRAFT_270275 [Gongronella butleri]|nr:hypothetical protein BC940DRAFT_270275 [Gongronella butleri]